MRRVLFTAVLVLAAACGTSTPEPPAGTFQGLGQNVLTLDEPAWSLRTGGVLWSGTYRLEDDRLTLRTDAVEPVAGHASDCLGAEESYRWRWEGPELRLSFEGEPCNQNRWSVLTGFAWRPRESA